MRAAFEATKHKTLATLRADGSPRVSGIEAYIIERDLWFGSMPGAVKGRDLQRDPRFALHGPPVLLAPDSTATLVARGFAADAFAQSLFFAADLDEVVLTRMEDTGMVIDRWRPGQSLRHLSRG